MEICKICFNYINSINLSCDECNKNICINCCNNLLSRSLLFNKIEKTVHIKYKCPYCRKINIKNTINFDKKELFELYLNSVENLTISVENNNIYKNDIDKINNKYLSLKSVLNNVTYINKNNIKLYDNLLYKYNNLIKYKN